MKPTNITDLAKAFVKSLPDAFTTLNQEMRIVLEQYCQEWLHKMDVVTQEEFEIQIQVLHKTREKLEKLERQLESMNQTI